MIRLLKFLVTGDWHLHLWEQKKMVRIKNGAGETVNHELYCECKICGMPKSFRM